MIFKTFDSDIDKISAKWGIFGKSFNDIGNAIVGRIKDINKGFQSTDDLIGSIKNSDSVWKRLYPSKETIQSQMIDIDALYPEKTDAQFTKLLSTLTQQQDLINTTKGSWTEYFKNLGEGEKWQIGFIQNTDLQKASLDDVKKAYNSARDAAIAHNAALKQQTLGAKAATVAMKALSVAGNMIAMWAISEVIGGVINYLDEFSHKAQNIAEEAESKFSESNEQNETYKQNIKSLDEYKQKYQEILNSNDSEIDKRKSLLELQGNINKLVGTQCEGLDLVNGKLDEQIGKIEKISKNQKKDYYNNAVGNYTNAKKSANSAIGQNEKYGATFVYKENNISDSLNEVLQKNGYGNLVRSGSDDMMTDIGNIMVKGTTDKSVLVYDGVGIDGTSEPLQKRVNYLKGLQKVLLAGGQGDSGLYGAVTSQIQKWEDLLKKQKSSAEDVIKSYIDLNANPVNINSVDDYKNYIDTFTGKIKKDKNVSQIIKDGVLNDEDIKTIVNDYISVLDGFSEWYDKWKKNNIEPDQTDNLSRKTFNQIWNSLGTGTDEASKKVAEEKENLLKLAEAGQLTEEAFKNSSIADTFTKAGYSIEEATKLLNAFIDNTKQLSAMKTGITAITSAYDEKKEAKDNRVGSDTLNSLYGTLGIQEWKNKDDLKVWEKYKEVASDSKSSLTELKNAQDKLATSFVNSNNFLSNLNEENEDYYKNLLAEMGVTNAESIVTEKLAGKKEFHALKSKALAAAQSDLSNKTDDASASFLEEAACCDEAKFALADYVAKETIFNNSNLNVDDKVTALENLAEAYYGAAAAASFENKIKTSAEGAMYGGGTISPEKAWKQIQKDYGKIKPVKVDVKTTKGNKSDNKKNDGNNKGKNTKTEINWLERRLTRMQSIIDLTASKLQNLFSVKAKNNNLDNQIKQSTKLMNQYKIAADTYIKKANSVAKSGGLSKDIINKVQSGEITKSSYSKLIKKYGQKKADKINSYIDYYDKSQDAKKNAIDLESKIRGLKQDKLQNYVDLYDSRTSRAKAKEAIAIGATDQNKAVDTQIKNTKLSYDYQIKIAKLTNDKAKADQLEYEKQKAIVDLKKQQIENLKTEYDNRIGLIDNGQQDANNQLSQMEARGQIIQSSYYSNLNNYENQKLSKLNSELKDLQGKQNTFTKYSQEWYDLQSDIQSVKNAINDAETAIIENNKKVGELRQAMYDDIASRNSNISTEASFLAGLLGDNLTDDKTGNLTKEGLATLGAYAIGMESNTSTALSYKKDREELEKQIADYKNGNSHALDAYGSLDAAEKKLDEIIQKQQDAISAEYDSEKQIYDLMTQRYETQLSYMQSIIDAKKNLLDMEKDIYDYEKNINNQTKSIASLEKQLTALQGDDSESGRLRRSQLQQSLDEANQELQDTEYERYISDQQNMLDNLYSQYEDLIHELEKNFEEVVQEGVELINTKSGKISEAITDYAKKYGYNPSKDMKSILGALTSSGDGDVKTLPGAINNGFSNLGMIFQKGVTDIVNAYNGTKSKQETQTPETQDNSDNSGADKNHKDRQNSQVITADGANISLQNMQNAVNINSERDKLKKLVVGKNYSTKATKSYDKYSSKLNQMLAKHTGYVIKSGANDIQAFALSLGLKTATNGKNGSKFAQDGNVYQELKKRFSSLGFSSGGIGQLIKASGEDGLALVRNGEGFIAPEHVQSIKELVNIVPDITQFTKSLTNIKPVNRNIGNTFGDIVINAELPNVKDSYDFIDDIKNNRKTQQALTIATKDVIEKGKITNNIQSIM